MKLSEVRKCDVCGGALMTNGMFYVVRTSLAFVSHKAAQQTMGLYTIFGGGSSALGIAEAMSPDPDVIKVAGDEDKKLMSEALICQECYLTKPICLAQTSEQVSENNPH